MTARDDFDRHLAAWFAADAAEHEPEHLLGHVLAQTARTRRRPAWLVPERWIPMSAITTRVTAAPRLPWRLVGVAALLILALVVGALLIAGAQPTKLPAPFGRAANGLVAYSADGDIYTVDPASGVSSAVVAGPETDLDPVWSLDGTRLAFRRQQPDGDKLYVARSDGRELRALTPDGLIGVNPQAFSPDGRQVLYTHRSKGLVTLALANADGSAVREFDVGGLNVVEASFRPPDGGEILFVGSRSPLGIPFSGLFVIAQDGAVKTLKEPGDRYINEARYSPDGSRIAYYTWRDAPVFTVRTHVAAADGTADRLLDPAETGAWDAGVAWSNDGTRLAIVRGYDEDGYSDTHAVVMSVDDGGGGVETDGSVIVNAECCASFSWSPDDSVILWTPTNALGLYQQQLLVDPATGAARPAPWSTASEPAWQRLAP